MNSIINWSTESEIDYKRREGNFSLEQKKGLFAETSLIVS